MVWADVRQFLENPGEVLARVREQMESDNEAAELQERHADLATRLAAKHKERDRWLHLYTQGHISEGELKLHLADVGTQLDNLKLLLSSVESDLATKHEVAEVAESTEAWLLTLRERLSEVEEDTEEAFEKRRQLVRLLVAGITAGKNEDGRPDVRITYRFGPPEPTPVGDKFVHGVHSLTRK
jgi:DNA-binding transcriptional MerR regulator